MSKRGMYRKLDIYTQEEVGKDHVRNTYCNSDEVGSMLDDIENTVNKTRIMLDDISNYGIDSVKELLDELSQELY